MSCPEWVVETNKINEVLFCEDFLDSHPMVSVGGSFFTVDGKIHDETRLRKIIYDEIKPYVTSGISKKVSNLLDVLRMECCVEGLPLHEDRISNNRTPVLRNRGVFCLRLHRLTVKKMSCPGLESPKTG